MFSSACFALAWRHASCFFRLVSELSGWVLACHHTNGEAKTAAIPQYGVPEMLKAWTEGSMCLVWLASCNGKQASGAAEANSGTGQGTRM